MNAVEFNALPFDLRANYLWDFGRFLTNRRGPYFMCNLYAVDSFYVEVLYHQESNTIADVTGFEDTEKLSEYLDEISLKKLLHS